MKISKSELFEFNTLAYLSQSLEPAEIIIELCELVQKLLLEDNKHYAYRVIAIYTDDTELKIMAKHLCEFLDSTPRTQEFYLMTESFALLLERKFPQKWDLFMLYPIKKHLLNNIV